MQDPITRFQEWFAEAQAHPDIADATAMTVATASRDGLPSARVLLLKECTAAGFLFYTNLTSRKSLEIRENPHASLCFYWSPLGKQVRVEGQVEAGDTAAADAYFASRPRARQLGAWASLQSQPMTARSDLDQRLAAMETQYADRPVPRPPHWSGWRLVPARIEFWQASDARLHERECYIRQADGSWALTFLYP